LIRAAHAALRQRELRSLIVEAANARHRRRSLRRAGRRASNRRRAGTTREVLQHRAGSGLKAVGSICDVASVSDPAAKMDTRRRQKCSRDHAGMHEARSRCLRRAIDTVSRCRHRRRRADEAARNIFRSVTSRSSTSSPQRVTDVDRRLEVVNAAATSRSLQCLVRPGLGGHCIPVDPFYLTEGARVALYGVLGARGQVNEDAVLLPLARLPALTTRSRGDEGQRSSCRSRIQPTSRSAASRLR